MLAHPKRLAAWLSGPLKALYLLAKRPLLRPVRVLLLSVRVVFAATTMFLFGSALTAGTGSSSGTGVAITKSHGVNPRREILWEVAFLAPPFLLAIAAYLLVSQGGPVHEVWDRLVNPKSGGWFAPRAGAFLAALFGYLIGGLWVWGIRIFGTLGFGKEAMGLGDVHIMAAVGAVTGWIVPSIAFFLAPCLGVLWALYLWLGRGQRELPYGPWLATASLLVMIFYDTILGLIGPYAQDILL
jgi:prepilin signal peptidase PulO-like enzyme (type II secretory pathway)